MKQTIIGLTALVLALSGCKKTNNPNANMDNPLRPSSQTETSNYATVKLPSDCRDLVDARFITGYNRPDKDQVLCKDNDGNLVLYVKSTDDHYWTARKYIH